VGLTVGELNVELDARTREFRAGLRQAERRLGRFERQAGTSTARVATSFRSLGAAVALVSTAIVALGAAFTAIGLGRFIAAGVESAAAFRSLAVSLEVLTGSAEGAQEVLAEVRRLVVATPFGLRETASAARSLSVVFKDNTAAAAEFTGIAADIGAAFEQPIEIIGRQLTRAFNSGLASAEILRDEGITPVILELAGVSDVSRLTTEQFIAALRELTEEGGRAFGAAAKQAEELGGALSNTSIAFENFRTAVGEAIADPLAEFLVNVLQPAFMGLQTVVEENAGSLSNFAENVLGFVGTKFGELFQFVIDTLRVFADLGDAFDLLRAAGAPLIAVTAGTVRIFVLLVTTLTETARIALAAGRAIIAAGKFDFAEAGAQIDLLGESSEKLGDRFDATVEGLKTDAEGVIDAFSGIGDTREFFDNAADGLERLRDATKEAAEAARSAPPVIRERAPIDLGELPERMPMGGAGEGQRFGERFAEGFSATFRRAIDGESVDFIGTFTDLLGDASEDSLKDAFQGAVDEFGGLLKSAVGASGITGLFQEGGAFGGIGNFFRQKLGDNAGKELGGAALGILGAGISAFRRQGDARSTAARVQSAITSVAQVRGIVSGPTSIAIASVAPAIEDSFLEPTRILRLIEENTRTTARQTSDTGTGSVPTGGTSEATQALGNEGASLV
jgi:hypothetical protein